jgi:hypothetical protein
MLRKNMAFVLPLIAIFAFVSLAAANNLTAGKYPATLTISDSQTAHGSLGRWNIGAGARYIECTTTKLTATISEKTTKLTLQPLYENCFYMGLTGLIVTIKPNKCHYILEATSKTTMRTTIACENPGEQMEIYVEGSGGEGNPVCTYDLEPQGPLAGINVSVLNGGTATESLSLNYTGIFLNVTNTWGGPLECGVKPGGKLQMLTSGKYTLSASSGGVHTPIMIE